jgi:hypothetical protein
MDPKVKFSEWTPIRDVDVELIGWRRRTPVVNRSCKNVE